MCGIAGWIGAEGPSERVAAVRRAVRAMTHRGPDSEGLLVLGAADGDRLEMGEGMVVRLDAPPDRPPAPGAAVIGHRRLAIIDRSSAGNQPMVSADGRHVIVLNGEIYNFVELREELERLGHRFRSRSDTEVLLAAFAEWGAACLRRLTGMFAFVVVDRAAKTAFLARDAFGMKPLYYASAEGGGIAFASELAPLIDLAGLPRRADPEALLDYLDLGSSDHGDRAMLAGVRMLPPAHHATVTFDRPRQLAPVRWWTPGLDTDLDLSFADAAARLRDLFLDGVRLHLRSDVTVGTLLSGGLDSSAIVMAMRELGGAALDIHTFSYLAGRGAIDETPWIDDVNRAARAVSHPLRLEADDWAADFDRVVSAQEVPFGSPAVHAQFRLFAEARRAGVGVVLDGQGADELMGGYRSMWADRLVSLLRGGRWPDAARFWLRAGRSRFPGDPGARRLAAAALVRLGPVAGVRRALPRRRRLDLVDGDWFRARGVERRHAWTPPGPRALRQALWRSLDTGSLPGLLRFEDRNSMAHSVEARLPFLTPQLAEFALALPEEYLVAADGTSKAVFREAMRPLVPAAVLDRRDKVGFSVPVQDWLPRVPRVAELLDDAATYPFLNPARTKDLARRARASALSVQEVFLAWRLVGLAGWVRRMNVAPD